MSHTCAYLTFHLVWATKNRAPMIKHELKPQLYAHITSIARYEKVQMLAIGGTCDHIHLLIRLSTSHTLAKLLCRMKSRATCYMRYELNHQEFTWQPGYAAYPVTPQLLETVAFYITNQEEHHTKNTLDVELEKLFNEHKK